MREFDVTKFGAFGNGVDDDTLAIQAALNAARSNDGGGRVVFPAGVYKVTDTLELGLTGGGVGQVDLVGHGKAAFLSGYVGPQTKIVDGTTGAGLDPLLRLASARSMSVQDLSFVGRGSETTGTLLEVVSETGFHSELITLRRVTFNSAAIGVRFGVPSEVDPFVGNALMERCGGDECATWCLINGVENSNFRFNFLNCNACGTVIDVVQGGGVNIDTANFAKCGVDGGACIRFGDSGTSGGQNIAVSRLTNVRLEALCLKYLVVKGDWQIAVDGMHEAQKLTSAQTSDPPIELRNCSVAFNQCAFQTHGPPDAYLALVTWSADSGRRCTLRFRDTLLDASTFTIDEWIVDPTAARCHYSIHRCDLYTYIPITDVDTW